jgi:hypothetical protein
MKTAENPQDFWSHYSIGRARQSVKLGPPSHGRSHMTAHQEKTG